MRWPILLGLWAVFALAAAASIEAPPAQTVYPGDYVTAIFRVHGKGTYQPKAFYPKGWQALPLPQRLTIHGRGLVAVTVRVPDQAPAGSRAELALLLEGEGKAIRAETVLRVGHRPRIRLQVVSEGKTKIGQAAVYRVTVANLGNAPDTVHLTAKSNIGETWIEPDVVPLAAGAQTQVRLLIRLPKGVYVSSQYRMNTWVYARGESAKTRTKERVVTTWVRGRNQERSSEPRLRLHLAGGIGVDSSFRSGSLQDFGVYYRLAPSLSGRLSDYVQAEVKPRALEGSLEAPLSRSPSGVRIRLSGPKWATDLRIDPYQASTTADFEVTGWRWSFGGNTRYDLKRGGLDVRSTSTDPSLNLQIGGGLAYLDGETQARAQIEYVRPLPGGFRSRTGLKATGFLNQEWSGLVSGHQALAWSDANLSALAELSATPQLGQYAVGASLGSRRLQPLGFRAFGIAGIAPGGLNWRAGGSLYASPWPRNRFELRLLAIHPGQDRPTYRVASTAQYRLPELAGVRSQLQLGYRLSYRPGDPLPSQNASAGFGFRFQSLSLSGRADYGFGADRRWALEVVGGWRPRVGSTLEASLRLDQKAEGLNALGRMAWEQDWGNGFTSTVFAEHSQGEKERDLLQAVLTQSRLFSDDLGISMGYGVEDPDGMGKGEEAIRHNLRFALVFQTGLAFDTPKPVVDAFGGRRVGIVTGRAFLDRNQDGKWQPGEPPIADLEVALGGAKTRTNAEGEFRLEVRPGVHRPAFRNLPADLDLDRPVSVSVRVNQRYALELPLAKTATVTVILFNDTNRNGRQDPGEFGIPYAGVRFLGPHNRSALTDLYGRALVTGLLPGRYRIGPDPQRLPPGYTATGSTLQLDLEAGKHPNPLALGAARPPKGVKTTYRDGMLAVFVILPEPSAPPGAEIPVRALVTGEADAVWVELGGRRWALAPRGQGRYQGTVRLPTKTPAGPLPLTIKASRNGKVAVGEARLQVVLGRLYRISPQTLKAGKTHRLVIRLRFHAKTLRLLLGKGEYLEMQSEDGYRWQADYTPRRPGRIRVTPIADGEPLKAQNLTVTTRTLSERQGP